MYTCKPAQQLKLENALECQPPALPPPTWQMQFKIYVLLFAMAEIQIIGHVYQVPFWHLVVVGSCWKSSGDTR